jgi:hypothetical protein
VILPAALEATSNFPGAEGFSGAGLGFLAQDSMIWVFKKTSGKSGHEGWGQALSQIVQKYFKFLLVRASVISYFQKCHRAARSVILTLDDYCCSTPTRSKRPQNPLNQKIST